MNLNVPAKTTILSNIRRYKKNTLVYFQYGLLSKNELSLLLPMNRTKHFRNMYMTLAVEKQTAEKAKQTAEKVNMDES